MGKPLPCDQPETLPHVRPALSSNFKRFFTNASAVPLQRENVQKKTRQKQTFALQLATKPLY